MTDAKYLNVKTMILFILFEIVSGWFLLIQIILLNPFKLNILYKI